MKKRILTVSAILLMGGGLSAQNAPAPQTPAPTATPPAAPAQAPTPTQNAPAATPSQQAAPAPAPTTTAAQPTPTAAAPAPAQATQATAAAPQPAAPAKPTFTQEQLDTALAPIALYPDSLLAQLLMATTYPDQVLEAAKWSKANPKMKGDEAVKAVQDKGWDPSVASLVAFPQVLEMLSQKPEWVKELGDMFLADPDAVMLTIQGLRKKAYDAGNLKSTKEQKVVVQESGGSATASSGSNTTIIEIQPADPQTVYVPVYNPTVVYGSWWYPTPPYYYHPPYYNPVAAIIGFGAAVAIGHALWSHWDWHHHDININVNRYNNININKRLDIKNKRASWRQNIRERNPRYNQVKRDRARDRLNNRRPGNRPGVGDRMARPSDRMARPGDRTRDLQRERAKQELKRKGGVDLDRARDNIRKNPDRVNKAIDRANRMSPSQKQQLRDRAAAKRPAGSTRPTRDVKRPSKSTRPVNKRPVSSRPKTKRPSAPKKRVNRSASQMRPANLNRQMRSRPSRASRPHRSGGHRRGR